MGLFKMKKKAVVDLQLSWVVDLLMLVLLISTFMVLNNKIKTSQLHDMKVSVRDLSLTHDAVSASPNEVYSVIVPKKNMDVILDDSACVVVAKSKESVDTIPLRFPCSKSNLAKVSSVVQEDKIVISKT